MIIALARDPGRDKLYSVKTSFTLCYQDILYTFASTLTVVFALRAGSTTALLLRASLLCGQTVASMHLLLCR
jgi:hypothetical protein